MAAALPRSAWVLGWSSLAAQLLLLADHGLADSSDTEVVVSVVLGAVVVGWVSAGVLAARKVRVVLAFVLMALALVGDVAFVVDHLLDGSAAAETAWSLVHLAGSLVALVALTRFRGSAYFARRRADPRAPAADVGGLVAIAVLVGAVGGITDRPEPVVHLQLRV